MSALAGLRSSTLRDLTRLWPLLDMDRLDETFPVFAAAVLQMVRRRRVVAAYLTTGRAPANLPVGIVVADLLSASVISVKLAMTERIPIDQASRHALLRTMGVVDKYVTAAAA